MNILDIAIAKKLAGGGGGSGTDNYNDLSNLPKINDTTLSGNKSSSALGLQSEINSDSKLASDLVDDTNQDNKFVTSTEKNTWNGKQNAIDSDHKLSSDLVDDANKTNKFVTSTEKNTWNGKQNAIDSDHKLSSDLVDDANNTNKFVTSTEKNTWNAKQNAIDADHKLSSSLVSFTTAEAAALASGIDSSKVGQISTNQTNILYAINRVGKNIFDITTPDSTRDTTVTPLENGGATISCTNASWTQYYKTLPTEIGKVYKVVLYIDSISGVSSNQFGVIFKQTNSSGTNYTEFGNLTATGTYEADFTATVDTLCVAIFLNNTTTAKTSSASIRLLICEKSVYDTVSSDYQPFALPNYDLTRLESEDRAALAEEIDAGAKNLLDFANLTRQGASSSTTVTKTDTQVTVTANNTTWANVSYKMTLAAGIYYFSCKISNLTVASGTRACIVLDSGSDGHGTRIAAFDVSTGTVSFPFVWTGGTLYIFYYPGYSNTANSNSFTAAENMVCTKAAFGVSNKFVPYRPNYDLVCDIVNKANLSIKRGNTLTSGSLNDVINTMIANGIYICFSAGTSDVSDKPAQGIFMHRTTMIDSTTAMQEVVMLTGENKGRMYVRTYATSVWTAWKETTNA